MSSVVPLPNIFQQQQQQSQRGGLGGSNSSSKKPSAHTSKSNTPSSTNLVTTTTVAVAIPNSPLPPQPIPPVTSPPPRKQHPPHRVSIRAAIESRKKFISLHRSECAAAKDLENVAAALFTEVVQKTSEHVTPNPLRTAVSMYLLEMVCHDTTQYKGFLGDLVRDIFQAIYLPNISALSLHIGPIIHTKSSSRLHSPSGPRQSPTSMMKAHTEYPLVLEPYLRRSYFTATLDITKKIQQAAFTQKNAILFAQRQSLKIIKALEDWGKSAMMRCFRVWRSYSQHRRKLLIRARNYFVKLQFKEQIRSSIQKWVRVLQAHKLNTATETVRVVQDLEETLLTSREELNDLAAQYQALIKVSDTAKAAVIPHKETLQHVNFEIARISTDVASRKAFYEKACHELYGEKRVRCPYRQIDLSLIHKDVLLTWARQMTLESGSSLEDPVRMLEAVFGNNSISSAFDATSLVTVMCGAFPAVVTPKDVLHVWKAESLYKRAEQAIEILQRIVATNRLFSPQKVSQGDGCQIILWLSILFHKYTLHYGGDGDEMALWRMMGVWSLNCAVQMVMNRLRDIEDAGGGQTAAARRAVYSFADILMEDFKDILPTDPTQMGSTFEMWRRVLLIRTKGLQAAFDAYSHWGADPQLKVISVTSLWRFVKEYKLLLVVPRSEVTKTINYILSPERVMARKIQTQRRRSSVHQTPIELTPAMFSEFLVRISIFSKKPFQSFIDEYVTTAGNMHGGNKLNQFQIAVRDIRVRNVLARNHDALHVVFSRHSVLNLGSQCYEVDEETWVDLCTKLGWIDDAKFNGIAVRKTFTHCQSVDVRAMDFQEFIDAVVAVSLFRNPNPFQEASHKVEQLIHASIVPYYQRIQKE